MYKVSDIRFIERVRSNVLKTIETYRLIMPEDKILVAVSGGKDSLSLLDILAWRKQILSSPSALYVANIKAEEIPSETDTAYLNAFCERLSVPFMEKRTRINLHQDKRKGICYLCSRQRRKELFILAGELNCNKVAFGHHLDDLIETLLMNMIHHGTFCSIPAKLELFEGKITLIRPLVSVTNNELARYATLRGFKPAATRCPYEHASMRNEVRKLILEMTHLNKKVKQNLFRSMTHIESDFLP